MTRPHHDESRGSGTGPDMSPEAIEHRLDIVSELRKLCLWLGTAKKVEDEDKKRPPNPRNE